MNDLTMAGTRPAESRLPFSPIPTDGEMKFRHGDTYSHRENALMWSSKDLYRWSGILLASTRSGDVAGIDRARGYAQTAIEMEDAFLARRRAESAAERSATGGVR